MMATEKKKTGAAAENIVMLPMMAQGHINPFLALSIQLQEQRGSTITFVNTPLNIRKLRSTLPPHSSVRLIELPFNSSDHGLPPDSENTDALPPSLILRLLQASSSLRSPFRNLISDLSASGDLPLCVLADMFFGWALDVAREFGVPNAVFVTGGGFGTACYYSLWTNMPWLGCADEIILPDFPEASKIHVTQMPTSLRSSDGHDPFAGFLKKELAKWSSSDGILVNTVEELDKIGLTYLRRKLDRPIWPIGPVLRAGGTSSDSCMKWLDSKPPNSVLYISFGSQNTISESQMMQLATALEVSCKHFIWVVRPPLGFDINSEFKAEEWLPQGFQQRIIQDEGRGILIQKWAAQVEILSHESVSAFLSHCGWNSVLEALSHGVPIIGWPMAADQYANAVMLEKEVGVCVEVGRGVKCEVKHEDIVRKIELVMDDTEKGKDMRRKAVEAKGMIKDAIVRDRDEEGRLKGSSLKAMDEFFKATLSRRKTKLFDTISELSST